MFDSIRPQAVRLASAAVFFWAAAAGAAGAAEPDLMSWDGAPVAPVALKASVVVDGGVVRLSDLFENAGAHGVKAVAYSPKPGQQSVFGVHWLVKAANYYNLEWTPETHEDQAVVTRSITVITADAFIAAVRAALAEHGVEDGAVIELDNPLMRVEAPGGSEPSARVEALRYDRKTGRFTAVAAAPADAPAAKRLRISGRAFRMLNVPTPAETLSRGDIITERDLVWIEIKAERLREGAIVDADGLIGMSPKRTLSAGRPVHKMDVQKPILVKRGSTVTIRLEYGGMSLSAQGRALENGALGDVIRISNTQSSQIIEGEVDSGGGVIVRMDNALAMN